MKKIFFLIFFISIVFSSCQNDSLNPLPVINEGQYVKFEINKKELVFDEFATTSFGGRLTDTSGKIVRYELFIRRTNANGYVLNDYVKLQTITSFPYDLYITPTQIAVALGLSITDLKPSDVFRFQAFSYDANGNKAGYNDLARILQITDTMQQGYKFNTDITLPLVKEDPKYDNRADIF